MPEEKLTGLGIVLWRTPIIRIRHVEGAGRKETKGIAKRGEKAGHKGIKEREENHVFRAAPPSICRSGKIEVHRNLLRQSGRKNEN